MPEVEKVLVYWKGDDRAYEMNRKEFIDSEQGTFMAHIDRTVKSFADYFKMKWENDE